MNQYNGVSLPKNLLQKINEKRKKFGYTSNADFIRQAIRRELDRIERLEEKE